MKNYLAMTDAAVISEATAIPYGKIRSILVDAEDNTSFIKNISVIELRKYGLTNLMAERFMALLNASYRVVRLYNDSGTAKITSSKDIADLFSDLSTLNHEQFYIQPISRSNKLLGQRICISVGAKAGVDVDKGIIAKHLILREASAFICVHNHPSGNIRPSDADLIITHALKNMGTLLDIRLLDHVIIADNTYYSFADEGVL